MHLSRKRFQDNVMNAKGLLAFKVSEDFLSMKNVKTKNETNRVGTKNQ